MIVHRNCKMCTIIIVNRQPEAREGDTYAALPGSHYFPLNRAFQRKLKKSIEQTRGYFYG